ncbi:hypothetical protein [Streptomyces sp. WAC07061]|uniref:hypothetical protein n=1 Tax=Streptomyces sp. WAC07061 TaxID=2487410 RepID=UPI00163CDE97|nr:hypothetical protein [Streptomyces sp. WAC07061]
MNSRPSASPSSGPALLPLATRLFGTVLLPFALVTGGTRWHTGSSPPVATRRRRP